MKKTLFILFLSCQFFSSAQPPGEWTWMNGTSSVNSIGYFGTQGIPGIANMPPAVYEAREWTDKNGNFWLYGGYNNNMAATGDLWRFDPALNIWTWMFGTGNGTSPNYGIKGVPSPTNNPGARIAGFCAWTDTSNNLWLFGGVDNSVINFRNDLWKYDIAANEWTWISGDTIVNSTGNYGIMGVPSVNNIPPARKEVTSQWVDATNNLWLFGGSTIGQSSAFDDVWKYSISTNEWTWIKGSNTTGALANFGTKGISSLTNTPGARWGFSHWTDKSGNFWMFGGGVYSNFPYAMNDMWKYNMSSNEWVWMSGTSNQNDTGTYGASCIADSSLLPCSRAENKMCWTDSCGEFWMFGGNYADNWPFALNDFWRYDPNTNYWTLISGSSMPSQPGNFGTLGISNPNNIPSALQGACAWLQNNGQLWLGMGAVGNGNGDKTNAMWRYVPDISCYGSCMSQLTAQFSSVNNLCPGTCTDFLNLSLNATSYQWYFSGATPLISTDVNPANICYNSPGSYNVTLIATNAAGSDSLTLVNYITVYPQPAPQSIMQVGDTLFANAGATTYQWYLDGSIINGATDYFYVATTGGDYNVIATDNNGCEVEAVIFNVAVAVQSSEKNYPLSIYPDPVLDNLTVNTGLLNGSDIKILIYNMLGEIVIAGQQETGRKKSGVIVQVSQLPPGMYYLEAIGPVKKCRAKFVKR
jgi:hypothetical protein